MSGIQPIAFLDAVAGYVRGSTDASADRPIRLAVIDPAYDAFSGNYPNSANPARVTFEGETTLSGKAYPIANGYMPAGGNRVWMVPIGNSYLIAGGVGNYTAQGFYSGPGVGGVEFGEGSYFDTGEGLVLQTDADIAGDLSAGGHVVLNNVKALNGSFAVTTTTGTAFVNLGAPSSISFTKRYSASETKLIVHMKMSARTSVGTMPNVYRTGVLINGTDYTLDNQVMDVLNTHYPSHGFREVTGLAAGTYTVQARMLQTGTSRTLATDANDYLSLRVEEVPV